MSSAENHGTPEGWDGDWQDLDLLHVRSPERGSFLRFVYEPTGNLGWAGVRWEDRRGQQPHDSSVVAVPGGVLRFRVRGRQPGQRVKFFVGGDSDGGAVFASPTGRPSERDLGVPLPLEWTELEIRLPAEGLELRSLFGWSVAASTNGGSAWSSTSTTCGSRAARAPRTGSPPATCFPRLRGPFPYLGPSCRCSSSSSSRTRAACRRPGRPPLRGGWSCSGATCSFPAVGTTARREPW